MKQHGILEVSVVAIVSLQAKYAHCVPNYRFFLEIIIIFRMQ